MVTKSMFGLRDSLINRLVQGRHILTNIKAACANQSAFAHGCLD
jgi:hypothetical protein